MWVSREQDYFLSPKSILDDILSFLIQVLGASWYLASIGRQHSCWVIRCADEYEKIPPCQLSFLDCLSAQEDSLEREYWLNVTSVFTRCDAKDDVSDFKFGIFADAFNSQVASSVFMHKYLYSLWWGLRNLRCDGFCYFLDFIFLFILFNCCSFAVIIFIFWL